MARRPEHLVHVIDVGHHARPVGAGVLILVLGAVRRRIGRPGDDRIRLFREVIRHDVMGTSAAIADVGDPGDNTIVVDPLRAPDAVVNGGPVRRLDGNVGVAEHQLA